MGASKSIKEYAFIAFTLLGILFGMVIMNFIFSQLGTAQGDLITDQSNNVTNLTDAWLNATLYVIPEASNANYSGFTVVFALNATDDTLILPANFTIDSPAGTITNATTEWTTSNMSLTYIYTEKTSLKLDAETIQNNSLQAIVTYTEGSSTQFNTVSIAIILVLLISVFLVFWKIFVSGKKGQTKNSGGNFS